MRFTIQDPLRENIYVLIRKLGYHFLKKDEERSEYNLVRPIGGSTYPRFHIYLKVDNSTSSPRGGENLIFNLHLDQKRPIYPVRKFSISNGVYKGAPAHAGEYEGEIVEKEAERIKKILENK